MRKNILFLVLVLPLILHAQQSDWEWINPTPQGNLLKGIHLFNDSTVVFSGGASTIMRSSNGGTNWNVRTHVAGTNIFLSDVDFVDDETGFAIGDSGRVLKTTDGGTTWSVIRHRPNQEYHNAVWFVSPTTGFIAGESRLYYTGFVIKTTDGGNSWRTLSIPQFAWSVDDLWFYDADTGWACVFTSVDGFMGHDLIKTTDGGITWAKKRSAVGTINTITFSDPRHGWAAGWNGIILGTTDGGESWNQQSAYSSNNLLDISAPDSLHIYAVGWDGVVVRSSDGGAGWNIQITSAGNLSGVEIDRTGKGWVIGESGIIMRTTDFGAGWTWQAEVLGGNFLDATFNGPTHVWAVGTTAGANNYGLIARSTDGGLHWSEVMMPSWTMHAIAFSDPLHGWAAGSTYSLYHTSDGGGTWARRTIGPSASIMAIRFLNPDTGYITSGDAFDYVTEPQSADGREGRTAQQGGSGAAGESAHTSEGTTVLWKTVDGGNSWQTITLPAAGTHTTIDFQGPDTVWIGTSDYNSGEASVLRSTDAGATWSVVYTLASHRIYKLACTSAGKVVVAGGTPSYPGAGFIASTSDGGGSWSIKADGLPANVRSLAFAGASFGFAGMQNGGILSTIDGGETWKQEDSPTQYSIMSLQMTSSDTVFAFGRGGGILRNVRASNAAVPGIPTPTGPGAVANTLVPIISWSPAINAQAYRYQVAADSTFAEVVQQDSGVAALTAQLDTLADESRWYWRVAGENYLRTGPWSAPTALSIQRRDTTWLAVQRRWNLVSLPVELPSYYFTVAFPGADSRAYRYVPDTGYVSPDTVRRGIGYWVRYALPGSFPVVYHPVTDVDTVHLRAGWNLVGFGPISVPSESVTLEPPSLTISSFFGYEGQYFRSSELLPWKGYWVKASEEGIMIVRKED